MQEGCASLSPPIQETSFYEVDMSMEDNFFCAWGVSQSMISCCASCPDTVWLLLPLCSGCLPGLAVAALTASGAPCVWLPLW